MLKSSSIIHILLVGGSPAWKLNYLGWKLINAHAYFLIVESGLEPSPFNADAKMTGEGAESIKMIYVCLSLSQIQSQMRSVLQMFKDNKHCKKFLSVLCWSVVLMLTVP